jgi:hypothetical protein
MQHKNQHLITIKSYRLPPALAHKVALIAKGQMMSESQWVRQVLSQATQGI